MIQGCHYKLKESGENGETYPFVHVAWTSRQQELAYTKRTQSSIRGTYGITIEQLSLWGVPGGIFGLVIVAIFFFSPKMKNVVSLISPRED